MMKIKPLYDQFIVEELDVDTASDRKIQLLKKTHPIQQGKVVAVSDGYYRRPMDDQLTPLPVQVNDVVMFPANSGFVYDKDNPKYIMLKMEHVLGIVTQ